MDARKRIVFVDDEIDVIDGLRRMLHSMRSQWEPYFAHTSREALEILDRAAPVDVVVTDVRMPEIDGVQLLEEVCKRHPETVRIILSGQADEQENLRSVSLSHQYLAKPCSPDMLKSILNRVFTLRELLNSARLTQLTSRIKGLPSLPQAYVELTNELISDSPSLRNIGEIVARDIGMSARILQLVNSAYFGLRREIVDPREAVKYLGTNIIKALVLSSQVFSQFDKARMEHFSLESLFEHSMQTAFAAHKIAEMEGQSSRIVDESLLAGMLHDTGKLILADQIPEQYEQAMALKSTEHVPEWVAEARILGASHCEVGAYLFGLWGLPNQIIEAVAFHHTPTACQHQGFHPLTAVHVANALVLQGQPETGEAPEAAIDMSYLEAIGLNRRLTDWSEKVRGLETKGRS